MLEKSYTDSLEVSPGANKKFLVRLYRETTHTQLKKIAIITSLGSVNWITGFMREIVQQIIQVNGLDESRVMFVEHQRNTGLFEETFDILLTSFPCIGYHPITTELLEQLIGEKVLETDAERAVYSEVG